MNEDAPDTVLLALLSIKGDIAEANLALALDRAIPDHAIERLHAAIAKLDELIATEHDTLRFRDRP